MNAAQERWFNTTHLGSGFTKGARTSHTVLKERTHHGLVGHVSNFLTFALNNFPPIMYEREVLNGVILYSGKIERRTDQTNTVSLAAHARQGIKLYTSCGKLCTYIVRLASLGAWLVLSMATTPLQKIYTFALVM